MKYTFTILFFISCFSTLFAQVVKDTNLSQDVILQDVQTIELHTDSISSSMIVFAPSSFTKQRMGASTREQIMVLAGKVRFIFKEKVVEADAGTYLIIPANTAHRVEVSKEGLLKMLVIQDALK